jgi:excisionase family DNA binding protein
MKDFEIMTTEQAREYLSISKPTLLGMVKRNQIPHFYLGKRTLRFRKEALIKWIENLEKAG